MTFNFLGPGLTVNVEAKVKEQIILDSSASVHNPEFDFNDKAIATGAACLLTIALNRAAS